MGRRGKGLGGVEKAGQKQHQQINNMESEQGGGDAQSLWQLLSSEHSVCVCACASTCLCSYRVLLVLLHELQVPPALLQLLVDVHLLLLSSVVPLTKVQQLRLGVLTLLKHRNGIMHVHCLLDILCRNTWSVKRKWLARKGGGGCSTSFCRLWVRA